jgi:hypothetical protein
MTKNMASGLALSRWLNFIFVLVTILAAFGNIYIKVSQCDNRDCSMQIESQHAQHGIACTRSFHTGLTSAEGKNLECFKQSANNIFIITMKILSTHYVIKSCQYYILTKVSLCVYKNLYEFDQNVKLQFEFSMFQDIL